jgi:cell division protein FtsA
MEILEIVNQELISSGQKSRIHGGVVITGGTALLANLVDLAEQIFDLPVRIGYPVKIGGLVQEVHTPRCTTAVGLVMYGCVNRAKKIDSDASMAQRVKMWIRKII